MLFLIIVGFSHNSQKKYDPKLKLKMFQFFDNIIKALQWISDFHYNSQKVKAIQCVDISTCILLFQWGSPINPIEAKRVDLAQSRHHQHH
jgi:hypothetical protein